MGDRHGRVRVHRRDVSLLRGVAGNRPAFAGGCLYLGLSAAPEALIEGLMKLQQKISREQSFINQKPKLAETVEEVFS